MKLRESQAFLSLYYETSAIEVATGERNARTSVESWQGNTKELGQVATPSRVASLMAGWVMSAKPRTVLDPAAGLGGLLTACFELDPRVALVGVERDSDTLERAKATAPRGAKLILADYLMSDAGLFDGIIANPPYVKAHRLGYSESDWRYFEDRLGTGLDRLTNLYGLFLLKIWEDLAPRGRAAVILPAEFLNANFGEEIKARIVQAIRPAALIVFAPSVNVFADALTTSAIVFLEKGRHPQAPVPARQVQSVSEAASFVGTLYSGAEQSAGAGCVELTSLNPREKWLNLLLNGNARLDSAKCGMHVGNYFHCRRGIATGANDYFCLSRAQMLAHRISAAHVEPCITKAADSDGLVFTSDKFEALTTRERRCFLLKPARSGPDVARYLELGEEQGISQRHLPSHRPVWYLPENRAIADIWVAVFSRESVKFILNMSSAKNLTCFHGLYAKPGCDGMAALMTLFLNSSDGRRAFLQVNRFYGDGLNKVEPKDVEAMPCPVMRNLSRVESEQLICGLVEIEQLPFAERMARIDELAARYFGINSQPEEPL